MNEDTDQVLYDKDQKEVSVKELKWHVKDTLAQLSAIKKQAKHSQVITAQASGIGTPRHNQSDMVQ